MLSSTRQTVSIVLSAVLGAGMVVELVMSALHATWELEPSAPGK